jgi:RND family efflux transporter MFP subunit
MTGVFGMAVLLSGCQKQAPPAEPPMQAMPVKTLPVTMSPVAQTDEYVATIKSRRSANINPQVDGHLTKLLVHSGDHVKAGQLIMEIDAAKQIATVESQRSTEVQKKALYEYNVQQVDRQRKLFDAQIISKDAVQQAEQNYQNSKADYDSAVALRKSQEQQLDYYHVKAPFDGIVGDVPVHLGDYVSPTTLLTTVDENKDLEAYIYVPTNRAAQVHAGLGVDIVDNSGNLIEHSKISFVSPQVDNDLQGILAKAPVRFGRNSQLVKAHVIWSVNPAPVVPVLAVTRLGGQTFVYVAESKDGKFFAKQRPVTLGDTVGNTYEVLGGLQTGDKVIVSGTQFLMDGAPVQPLG